jgi:predicted transcriptional regulator
LTARVRQAVDTLPTGQRAAVVLFYLAGLNQAETAVALGIPPGAVKARLHKARANLRRALSTLWEETMTITDQAYVEVTLTDVRRIQQMTSTRSPAMCCSCGKSAAHSACLGSGSAPLKAKRF